LIQSNKTKNTNQTKELRQMEIEEPQHSRLQSLGFRIPGVNEEEILSIIAKKYKESVSP